MKAVRYRIRDGAARIGRLDDDVVVDAGPDHGAGAVPSREGWDVVAAASGEAYAVGDVQLLPPTTPAKIIGIGLNYRDHAEEAELDPPPVPVIFAKFGSALIGNGATIVVPREETRADWEGEVAVVIGRPTYRATRKTARDAVGGISVMNDVSGRRAQLDTPLRQFTLGKSFDTFAPFGPCIAAAEGIDLTDLDLSTELDGEVMQRSSTRHLIFSIVELIEYVSRGITLEPGDVIATGTPGGVGYSRVPPRYLQDGETVSITVSGVGTLTNPVAYER